MQETTQSLPLVLNCCLRTTSVRRQVFWNQCALKLRESLAHLVGLIMQRAGGDASAALRVSFV